MRNKFNMHIAVFLRKFVHSQGINASIDVSKIPIDFVSCMFFRYKGYRQQSCVLSYYVVLTTAI